jgi:uncharacterized membrane-anchored protein
MRRIVLIVSSLCIFAVLNYAIYEKEQVKANGETVYLELAPVDPRSLMQGDYMALRYAIERNIDRDLAAKQPKRGYMVIALDENRVARFVRFHEGEPLQPGEKLLRYHNTYGNIDIVPNSFLFQEGHAKSYEGAKYGEFKFDSAGKHILIGLASANRDRLIGKSE